MDRDLIHEKKYFKDLITCECKFAISSADTDLEDFENSCIVLTYMYAYYITIINM